MNPQIEALVLRKIQQFNIMMGAQQQPQPGQQPGMAEGGMPRPGIIPGPVTPGGGDNTLTPTQTGEYIIPVDAVMGLGVRMGATSPGDALATGKFVLDKEVMGLKKEMGNNTPPRNAGIEMAGPGMAEGGFISGVKDWVDTNIVDPVNNLVGRGAQALGIPTTPPPPRPAMLGVPGVPTRDTADKAVAHNQAVEEVARETGYAEGGYVDPNEFVDETPAPTMGIPAPPVASAPAPTYSPVTDLNLGPEGLSENVIRDKAIRQAIGGTGYLDPSILPAALQPNLQPTPGIPAGQGVGIGGGKVTMTPTTDKLATDAEGYYKELPNVQPGTGIMSVGGKTFDVAGMAPEQGMGVAAKPAPEGTPTAYKDLRTAVTSDLKAKGITDPAEIAKETRKQAYLEQEKVAKLRGEGFAASRPVKVYDIDKDQVKTVSLADLQKVPDKYMDIADPNFTSMKKNVDYHRMNANFVNTIDNYSTIAEQAIKKYGLNKDPKWMNYTLQDLVKRQGLGAGDVAGLYQLLGGLAADVSKIETGSLGISGASVEALKTFKFSPNMPAGELFKLFNMSKNAGRARLSAIDQETKSLRNNMLPVGAKEPSGEYVAPESPAGPLAGNRPTDLQHYMAEVRKANPGKELSDGELTTAYNSKYGGK